MGYMSHIDKDAMKVLKDYQSWQEERETLRQRLAEKDAEMEKQRIQIAACGVAAKTNTEDSAAKQRIDRNSEYWSASYQDVCDAVDREIALRKEVERLKEMGYGTEVSDLRSWLEKAESRGDSHLQAWRDSEARVRELEENNADAENRTIILEKRIKVMTRQLADLHLLLTTHEERIKAMTEAGDDLRWQVAEFTKATGLKESDAPRIKAWDKAKGEAVPYNDGAR